MSVPARYRRGFELRRPRRDGAVVAWVESDPDEHLHLSAVTLGELQSGVEIAREHDPGRAAEIEPWMGGIGDLYNVSPLDGSCFRAWARMMHRKSDDVVMDALIAACGPAGIWKLVSRVFVENGASRALLKSVGFREVGVYEKHVQLDGAWRDVVIVERLIPENITASPQHGAAHAS